MVSGNGVLIVFVFSLSFHSFLCTDTNGTRGDIRMKKWKHVEVFFFFFNVRRDDICFLHSHVKTR